MRRAPRICLVAGEASGDLLGAPLVEALRARFPDAEFAGIAGPRMRAVGVEAWHASDELAVMGLAEVLAHLPRLLRLRAGFRRRVLAWRPDVFIGIDAPDFNLPVERWLKQRGLRTVHYVSPSIWAWREGRAATIARSADLVLCLFPMEPPIYARHAAAAPAGSPAAGTRAVFVGHPLAERFPLQPDRAGARAALGLDDEPIDGAGRVLALLPGSRLGEIRRLLPDFLGAAARVMAERPDLRVLLPAANAACRSAIDAALDAARASGALPPALDARLRVLDGGAHEAMLAADAVLLASGTAALEAMLAKRPMVVGYRIAPLTHWLVKRLGLLKVARYSLPNILSAHLLDGRELAPERMQDACTPEALAAALAPLLDDPAHAAALQADYLRLHEALRQDASARAAEAIAALLAGAAPGADAAP